MPPASRRGRPAAARPPARRSRRPYGSYRPPQPDPARATAYEVLRAVDERDAYGNLLLSTLLRERGLDARDAAFATELAYGALRARGTLDAVLAAGSSRPLDQVDLPVRALLRLGAYQLLRTRVPAHAAVAATVELARAELSSGPAGFVNAVLRRVAERSPQEWLDAVAPAYDTDPVGHLSVVHAHPRWIVQAFRDALGGDLAETAAALAADDSRPVVHLVARPGQLDRAELLAAAREIAPAAEAGPWSPYAVRLPEGGPGDLAAVRDGRAGVQDEGSQLVALALAAAPLAGSQDRRWLDLCAGPGGKAALLAGLAGGSGASLLAVEKAPHRARLVAQALARYCAADVLIADATVPAWPAGEFDRVLLDAPCTGLGALRRRPEARWRRQPSDLPGLARLQKDLLAGALTAVRPGGVVAYVVCSPHLAETVAVVSDALRRHPDVERLDARPLLPAVPALGDGPSVQLWPHRHGTDAMHLTLLRRGTT